MKTTRKFQSAVGELIAWLEGKDKPGYASDTDFVDPAFEDMVDLQQKRKRLDELIKAVKEVSEDKDPPMRTCDTCKYFECESEECNNWWLTLGGVMVDSGNSKREHKFEPLEGFGCTSHEEKEDVSSN